MARLVPPRFNEGWGTWHAKIYGVDDEVMISGCVRAHICVLCRPLILEFSANLNNSYYTDRQDRYIHFTSQPHLAQYCFSFLESISTVSYKLLPTHSPKLDEAYHLQWPDRMTHPHEFEAKAESVLSKFQSSFLSSSPTSATSGSDVLVFPVIQGGQFNIREEEQCLSMLFDHLAKMPASASFKPNMDLTSGYFGLYKPYQDLILKSSINCRIIAASPKVKGELVLFIMVF